MFSNKWLVQQHIYLQDYRRHSVAVSERRNDHMQVYINIMEGKWSFFIWNDLMVDRLTGPRLMSLWSAWDCNFSVSLIITEEHQNKQRLS